MNFEILDRLPLVILFHLFTTLAAFSLGAYQLLRKKGTRYHKHVGWIWFALMTAVAVSAIFIQGFEGTSVPTLWGFSPIHLLVVLTLYSVPRAIFAIKRGDIKEHASAVKGLYMGGMVVAGLLTFLPGRTMYQIFFG